MPLSVRLVLSASDTEIVSEMSTTTESSTARGGKVYHPQVKDREHATDSARCAILAIAALGDAEADRRDASSYGGWATPYGGVGPEATDYHAEKNFWEVA